ncbi:hypothetical protein RI054_12g61660 [Pseudoscourfieldia marina]
MAAPGGADQPELAANSVAPRAKQSLVQQNLRCREGPRLGFNRNQSVVVFSSLPRRRSRRTASYLIPATLTRGPNSHRLPTDVAGAQGEPHLLNLTSEYIYLHAVEKGKKHDSTVLRIFRACCRTSKYSSSASRSCTALAAEALTENLVAAVEARFVPSLLEQEGAEEEARLLAVDSGLGYSNVCVGLTTALPSWRNRSTSSDLEGSRAIARTEKDFADVPVS